MFCNALGGIRGDQPSATGTSIVLADAELDGLSIAFARRIASFDRPAIAAAKNLINQVSLPSADRLLDAINLSGRPDVA
jgi:hypothetical protein